jgi:hypothetical protein
LVGSANVDGAILRVIRAEELARFDKLVAVCKRAQFGTGGKMRDAVVERRTDGEAVVQAEDLVGVGSLQCGAERVGVGVGPVVLADNLGRVEGARRQLLKSRRLRVISYRGDPAASWPCLACRSVVQRFTYRISSISFHQL